MISLMVAKSVPLGTVVSMVTGLAQDSVGKVRPADEHASVTLHKYSVP